MLNLTQLLTFEIGRECNYSGIHDLCPVNVMTRKDQAITDEMIIDTACKAYLELGFEGLISWNFYNEAMLHQQRILGLMVTIREKVPQSRFFMWTNGSIVTSDDRMKLFERIHITNYEKRTFEELAARGYYNIHTRMEGQELDHRMTNHYGEENNTPCFQLLDSFTFGNDGEVYACCLDWMNEIKIGNLFDSSLEELELKRWEYCKQVCGKQMTDKAHMRCRACAWKVSYPPPLYDLRIAEKAVQEIAKLPF